MLRDQLINKFAESEYNAACNSGMALEHLMMLIHEFLNMDPDISLQEAHLIILDNKSALCMTKYGKDTNNTRHINRGVHLVRNGENCEMHKIEWCEGGLQLSDIATKNVGETNLNPRMRYIMVRLDN